MGENSNSKPPAEHQFKNGHAGGPGRPKKPRTLRAALRRELFSNGGKLAKEVIEVLYQKAIDGNISAMRLILDHSKPDQPRR